MGASLSGVAREEARAKGGASGVGQEQPHVQPQQSPPQQEAPNPHPTDQSPPPSETARPEPQRVSNPKARRRPKSRSVLGAIEDIQRMPEEAIYEEFNRLLMNSEEHLTPLGDPPCKDVAARLKTCLQRSHERSCNCFKVMEQYQQCVIRATQDHLDDQAQMGSSTMVVVSPQAIPRPSVPPPGRSQRRWYKFWTWFR
ncbi:uncharacterized protein Dana_GF21049 [Drosophila ananassae]|uniref:CHCH domain-containing protein n=1 Tax=Drosophila ananassae TaxID=7217 RepID=B3MR73_DROAN|nr:uncharacterized protein LOC6503738 [Drosophila ananassae]EDV34278.1 uncharacterized protein Dana_GF21049 [Drosophila ananassae]